MNIPGTLWPSAVILPSNIPGRLAIIGHSVVAVRPRAYESAAAGPPSLHSVFTESCTFRAADQPVHVVAAGASLSGCRGWQFFVHVARLPKR